MLIRIAALVLAILLSGCATPLSGKVSRFHVLSGSSQSFVILPTQDQGNSLEFRSYASLVTQQLRARGWREATLENADVAIFFQYQISQEKQVAFSYPVLGQVASNTSYTTGTISTYGNMSTLNATTTRPTTLGVVGTGTGSRTEFDRAVRLTMYSGPAYRTTRTMDRVYEGEFRSSGSTGDLPTVMPALISGLFFDFPGQSGSVRAVDVPLQ